MFVTRKSSSIEAMTAPQAADRLPARANDSPPPRPGPPVSAENVHARGKDTVAKPTVAQPAAQPQLSAEEIAEVSRRATESRQLHASFGGIVGLLMRSPQFRNVTLADLENLVVPAVTNRQFMIAEAQLKQSGFITPVAAVLWASVSEEVDRRLSEGLDQPATLAPKDWKSGDIPWLIIAAGDQRLIKALQQRLQETVLKGRPLKSKVAGKDGKVVAIADLRPAVSSRFG